MTVVPSSSDVQESGLKCHWRIDQNKEKEHETKLSKRYVSSIFPKKFTLN